MLTSRSLIGWLSRKAPRGRARAAEWLKLHPGSGPVEFTDLTGHRRSADLRDHMDRMWFAGIPLGMPATVQAWMKTGDWVIDIGANRGIVTGQMCERVGPSGTVWAFEPMPENVAALNALCQDNGLHQLTVFAVALHRENGTAEIRLPGPGGSAWASFSASWNTEGVLNVPIRRLDDFLKEASLPPGPLRLVKLDVEGAEFDVLEGGRATWERFKPLLYLECNDVLLRDAGSSSLELLSAAADHGFVPASAIDLTTLDGAVVDVLLVHDASRRSKSVLSV